MVLKELIELENIGVIECLQYLYLVKQLLLVLLSQGQFIYNFDGSQGLRCFIQTFSNFSVGTCTQQTKLDQQVKRHLFRHQKSELPNARSNARVNLSKLKWLLQAK